MAQFISSLIGFFVLNCTWLAGGEGDDSDHPIGIGGNGGGGANVCGGGG